MILIIIEVGNRHKIRILFFIIGTRGFQIFVINIDEGGKLNANDRRLLVYPFS